MKCRRLCIFSMLACMVIVIAGNTALATTITASDDTWVREDSADSNRNGNDQINARTDISDGKDDNDVILLRFDASSVTPVSGVTLNLVWYRDDSSTGKTLSLYGLNESDPDEATWSETTVTYNNAPGLIPDGMFPVDEVAASHSADDIQDLDTANLTLLVADQPYGPQVTDEVYSFSGTALDDFINNDSDGLVSFLILRNATTSSNQARFQVKEVGTGAYLDTGGVVPEPASLVLCVLGLVGFAAIRRR
jgi:hypothetical protein